MRSGAQTPGRPSLASFLGRARKEGPAGRPHQNQRAEGTIKKIFLVRAQIENGGLQPALQKQFTKTLMHWDVSTPSHKQSITKEIKQSTIPLAALAL
ncbi:MAG: hypothetical protein RL571_1664 [Pseudomonadota bacterium]